MIDGGSDPSLTDHPIVRVCVLGAFEMTVAGRRLTRADWQRVSAERLVKLLVVTPGRRVTREVAAETLWPDAEPESSRTSLRKALHFASQALGDRGVLITTGGWVALDPARLDVDLDRLTAALDSLTSSDRPASRSDEGPIRSATSRRNACGTKDADLDAALEVALRLGALDLLPDDAFEDWLVAPRERLRSRWQRVALLAARRAQADRRTDAALEIVGRLLERDPADEAAHRLAIELYAAEGRHHAVRRQFEQCRRALREGLDVDPSEETVEAYRVAEGAADRTPGGFPIASRLVARQQELERVEPLLDRVLAGSLAALVIRGPAGIGKTRLLDETVTYARAAGWRVLEWRAVESAAALAYAPLRIGLAEQVTPSEVGGWGEPARSGFATLAPRLGIEPRLTFTERSAFVAALASAVDHLAQPRPLCVAIDDLPWLDPSSLELFGAIVSGLAGSPILIAATYRDDEPASPAATSFLDHVRRAGGLEMPLGPLALRDVQPLIVGHLGGETVHPALARDVFDRSLGNPLFCLELVRAGRDRGAIQLVDGRWSMAGSDLPNEAPATVRTLVASRTAALPEAARELLAIAAELGPGIEFETLAAVGGDRDGQLLDSLDAALATGLLVENGSGYAFAHPLFRLAVRGAWGRHRRGEVCFAIANAVAGVGAAGASPETLDKAARDCPDPVAVAEHALSACDLGVQAAIPLAVAFGFAAGERERRMFDRDHATTLLERSLAAWRRLPDATAVPYDASAAHALLADLRMTAGEDDTAARSFREAIATARTADDLARAYTAFFWLPYRHGDFETALAILEEGLAVLPRAAAAARARVRTSIGWCLVRLRRFDDALPQLEDALEVLERSGDRPGAMRALDFLGVLLRHLGRPDEGVVRLERSLALALALDDSRGEMLARIHIAAALTRSGHPARARVHSDRGLELGSLTGDRYAEAVGAWGAAEMEDDLGDRAAAAAYRQRELRLLASIGGNPHNEALAHAHLAHLARSGGDDIGFAREAETALTLAGRSDDTGYAARIKEALEAESWSRLET